MMEKHNDDLQGACSQLREMISRNKALLDVLQEETGESQRSVRAIDHLEIGKFGSTTAHEIRKHSLAYMQGGPNASDCKPHLVSSNRQILINLARMWQTRSKTEIQELLVEEKLRQTSLQKEKERILDCIKENKQLLEGELKEKMSLENKQEEIESQTIAELDEKVERVKKAYDDMKLNLKNIVVKFFPDPQVPGFTGIHHLLTKLTERLQNGERDVYVKVTDTWPYYLETLEANGIIERHPTDHQKIRIIDFSDGRLGP